jgi:transposase
VALEATANWYWIVDEIEQAGLVPQLVHPRKAKLMMGLINKTDKLDARGLNRLQRNGTLPTVWIPPGPLRELTRTRVVLVAQCTRWKNRLTATLAKRVATPRGLCRGLFPGRKRTGPEGDDYNPDGCPSSRA